MKTKGTVKLTEDAREEISYWSKLALVGDMVGIVLAAMLAIFGVNHLGLTEETNIVVWFAALVFTCTGLASLLLFMGKEAYHLWYYWALSNRAVETVGELEGELKRTCKIRPSTESDEPKALKLYEFSWGDVNRGFSEELNECDKGTGTLVRYLELGKHMFVVDIQPKMG